MRRVTFRIRRLLFEAAHYFFINTAFQFFQLFTCSLTFKIQFIIHNYYHFIHILLASLKLITLFYRSIDLTSFYSFAVCGVQFVCVKNVIFRPSLASSHTQDCSSLRQRFFEMNCCVQTQFAL